MRKREDPHHRMWQLSSHGVVTLRRTVDFNTSSTRHMQICHCICFCLILRPSMHSRNQMLQLLRLGSSFEDVIWLQLLHTGEQPNALPRSSTRERTNNKKQHVACSPILGEHQPTLETLWRNVGGEFVTPMVFCFDWIGVLPERIKTEVQLFGDTQRVAFLSQNYDGFRCVG